LQEKTLKFISRSTETVLQYSQLSGSK